MDNSKSILTKSKSSNSTLTKLKGKYNKSRSNRAFQTLVAKKRGVYVESKPSKESANNLAGAKEKIQSRPSRCQKRFLSPVLNILSKSSTQCEVITGKTKTKNKKPIVNNPYDINDIRETSKTGKNIKKKTKYICKSKVLKNRVADDIKFEILKPRNDMYYTPSTYSASSKIEEEDFENIKWSDFLPRLVDLDNDQTKIEKEWKLSQLVREVTEGRMIKEAKLNSADEPATLVADQNNDKGFFNFFVDLLETTFSVYNVKAEYDASACIKSAVSSKLTLQIDESVANKLNVGLGSPSEPSPSPSDHFRVRNNAQYCYEDKLPKKMNASSSKPRCYRNESPLRTSVKKKQKKSESFDFTKQQSPHIYSKSAASHPRKSSNVTKKKNLLDLLKEQLMMDACPVEVPQTWYQALKVMAKTKLKSHKTIRFNKSLKIDNKYNNECMFKIRKVISPLKLSSKQKDNNNTRKTRSISPRSSHFNRRHTKSTVTKESNHSLEVFNDYDVKGRRQKEKLSPSDSENNFKQYDAMMKHILRTVESIRKSKSNASTVNTWNS